MSDNKPDMKLPDEFEGNLQTALERAVAPSRPGFEGRLLDAVQREVAARRRAILRRRVWICTAAAAAGILVGLLAYGPWVRGERAGEVRSIYGFTTVKNGGPAIPVQGWTDIRSGQWVKTAWGSRADIMLADTSSIEARGGTTLQVERGAGGAKVRIQEGSVSVVAAKQEKGKRLLIETPGAKVTVLGTVLEVRVFEKDGGPRQTSVSVSEGTVELASAGKRVLLPRGTVGLVMEGAPPIRRSQTAEVSELMDLWEQTQELAATSGVQAGYPAIIEFDADGTATLWLFVAVTNPASSALASCALSSHSLVADVSAFSAAGTPLPARNLGATVDIDLTESPIGAGESSYVIVRVPDVAGFAREIETSVFRFVGSQDSPDMVRLIQFRLPDSAIVKDVSPEPQSVRRALERLVVTVACSSAYPEVFK